MRRYKKKHIRAGKFRSKLEQKVGKTLGRRAKFESERLPYLKPGYYIPDFVYTRKDGSKLYIEVKGFLRDEDQRKMKAVKASNMDLDIRFYFPDDKPVHRSKMLNSEWCTKYGFPYAIGSIPKEWLQ